MSATIASSTDRDDALLVADLAVCCSPITEGVLDAAAADRLAGVLKALAEPTRLRLVSLIAGHEGAEACVCDLTAPVGLSQPTVSHHLKALAMAGARNTSPVAQPNAQQPASHLRSCWPRARPVRDARAAGVARSVEESQERRVGCRGLNNRSVNSTQTLPSSPTSECH